MSSNNNILGPCLPHCSKENSVYILFIILLSIVVGIIIGINLGILIESKGITFTFDLGLKNNSPDTNDE